MRSLRALPLLIALTSPSGCSESTPPAPPGTSPAALDGSPTTARDNTSPAAETAAPDIDPKLTLAWPGTPQESRRRLDAGSPEETTIYSASLIQTGPAAIFAATVLEETEMEALRGSDLKEMLARSAIGSDEELTRKEIEHGPSKHPGLEVTVRSATSFVRRIVVLAGARLYKIEVASTKEERLSAEGVVKFFESFAIKE